MVPQEIKDLFDKEIEMAKKYSMPLFVMGLLQGYTLLENYFKEEDK